MAPFHIHSLILFIFLPFVSADTDHDFLNSRVIRKKDVTSTQAIWSKDDWTVCKSDYPDPGQWNSDICGEGIEQPSIMPSSSPTDEAQRECQFFFTELADCEKKAFIEIKSTCPGEKISRPIVVVSYKQYGQIYKVDLQGMIIPDDGFIIICRSKVQHRTNFAGQYVYENREWRDLSVCDIESYMILAGHGYNSYSMIDRNSDCDGGCGNKYLDIYGYKDSALIRTEHEYKGCRAVRNVDYPFGLPWFDRSSWEIICPKYSVIPLPGEACDPRVWAKVPLILFFTEFCDPKDDKSKRFIELYSPNKRDYKIDDDIIVMKWEGASPYPSYFYLNLKGRTINQDGFLVLCINWNSWNSDKCEVPTGYSSIVNSPGSDHFALAKCERPGNDCKIIDSFGSPGVVGSGSSQDFTNGRAYRLESNPMPKKVFDINQWVIRRNKLSESCDPGIWDHLPPEPTSAPTVGGKKRPSPGNNNGPTPSKKTVAPAPSGNNKKNPTPQKKTVGKRLR